MKITIFVPKTEFKAKELNRLSKLGTIDYVENRNELPVEQSIKLAKGSKILGLDPDVFGGFDKAKERVTQLIRSLPELKGVALASTSYSWIDLDFLKKKNLAVTNVPGYATEAVAEHTLGLLICLAKKIIINDRRYRNKNYLEGKYGAGLGFELKGKTLGIIGLGRIGSRIAELGHSVGMKVVAYNRTAKKIKNVKMMSLGKVLSLADAISINLAYNKKTHNLVGEKEIKKIKRGAIVVNITLVGREIIKENAMARALREKRIDAYAYEAEDLEKGPLAKIENAIGLKGFAWYTKESLERNKEIWVNNMVGIAKGKPVNPVI